MALAVGPGASADLPNNTWALVIGIDEYRYMDPLEGAVNDALDITDALHVAGAAEVRTLLNGEATRDAIISAWKELAARAMPGDTLVVSYAGHGGQEPERVPGNEADQMDEVLVLGGFDTKGPATYERIFDDEIAALIEPLGHLNVVLITDACHSGTISRSIDPRVRQGKMRWSAYGPIEDDALPPPPPDAKAATENALPKVVHLAAVEDHELAPEILIDDQPRGALSWAVADSLRGAADRDGNGILTRGELENYVRENIFMRSETRQHPQVASAAPLDARFLRVRSTTDSNAIPPTAGLPSLKLARRGGDLKADVLASLPGVVPATEAETDLLWDSQTGEIVNHLGDIVATVPEGEESPALDELQKVVAKWALLERLKVMAERQTLALRLQRSEPTTRGLMRNQIGRSNQRYSRGDALTLSVTGISLPYLTVFNLPADGRVQFLYPLAAHDDPLIWLEDNDYKIDLTVGPPFGADHVVAIASAQPLTVLHRTLERLDGKADVPTLVMTLEQTLLDVPFEMGLLGIYTSDPAAEVAGRQQ
jgi:hypothetical protein